MFLLSGIAIACLAALAHGYAAPGKCSGSCNIHDPGLVRRESDGIYFRFSTGNKISYVSSSSVEGPWAVMGSMLPGGSSINLPGRDDLWAPDVQYVNGQYHVYYAVSSFGVQDSAIGLATSPTMGPNTWTDHGRVGVRSDYSMPYNAIDPNFFIDTDGSKYIVFGSFWQDIFQVPMNAAGTKVSSALSNIVYDPTGVHAVEGAFLYKNRKWYYLFFSAGVCYGYDRDRPAAGKEYKIKVCRSDSVTGNFVDMNGVDCMAGGGTVVLESHDNVYGPGGQGIFTDPVLGPILYYHYVDTNIGYADYQKLFGWNKIDFSSGWPVV